ncbi:hypothetical protein LZ30DRAFT_721531 [Colletotrichum cereale]|nr:hypothetical protein LZ30DRAFT_721531 [Colletotrichum cereale]
MDIHSLVSRPEGRDESREEPVQHGYIKALSLCRLFIKMELRTSRFDAILKHLAEGINILNKVDHNDLDDTTLNTNLHEIAPEFQRLSIIQQCFYNIPGFPSLSRFNFNNRITNSIDAEILDAVQYIQALNHSELSDSRFGSGKWIVTEQQNRICASIDRWFETLCLAPTYEFCHKERSCVEADMRCVAAKICILACHYHDETTYDIFNDSFSRIVTLAESILKKNRDDPAVATGCKCSANMGCLPLLEFVILKCRWLGIRYRAWSVVRQFPEGRQEGVTRDEILRIGSELIGREHGVKIEEVDQKCVGQFPPPPNEIRIKTLADIRGTDTLPPVIARVPYTLKVLLRCGSVQLGHLVDTVEREICSGSGCLGDSVTSV